MKNMANETIGSLPVYRILFLEDNKNDVEFMKRELNAAELNFISEHVTNQNDFIRAVKNFSPHIILADYSLPTFDGLQAFRLLKEDNVRLPFVLVTGTMSEYMAVECLRLGIDDFILKSSFKRLPSAVVSAYEKVEKEKEKEKLSVELKRTQEELRLLLGSMQTSREEERKHIAREIHDELGQVMTALKINVSLIRKDITEKGCDDKKYIDSEFESVIELINSTILSVKRIATELRPEVLEHLGIIEAVKWQAEEFNKKTGIDCKVTDLQSHLEINAVLATTVYRIVQEALTNVTRHAKATLVDVMAGLDGKYFVIEIKDNGIGFSGENKKGRTGLGLIGMRERVYLSNGEIKITGNPGTGTTVSVKIPM